jgi:hypothetical protein
MSVLRIYVVIEKKNNDECTLNTWTTDWIVVLSVQNLESIKNILARWGWVESLLRVPKIISEAVPLS